MASNASRSSASHRAGRADPADALVSTLPHGPTLESLIGLLISSTIDICGLFVLLLQMDQRGFPLSISAIAARLEPALLDEFWFPPLAAAAVFPAVGCIFGIFCRQQWALYSWSAYSVVACIFRTYLCFEMRELEAEALNRDLLKDMIIASFFVLHSLSVAQSTAHVALDIECRRVRATIVRWSTRSGTRGRGAARREVPRSRRSARQQPDVIDGIALGIR